jgi:dihydrodipicolinate synthase/N-acetylneuraminate lyase
MQGINWRGVFPAATTQFHADQSLDLTGTARHLERLVRAGVHGIIVLGTVGENCSLEYAEKLSVLKTAVRQIAGRVPVLTGVAECTTTLACRYAADAREAGASGLMVLPAMVYKSDPREAIAHFRAVASASDLPIMVYNNPVSYGVDLAPPLFAELASEPKFVAIKESSENVRRITDLINLYGDRFQLFCGVDDLVLESVLLGVVGWVAGLVNAFPEETCLLWDLASSGRWQESRKLVQYIKLAAAETGHGTEMVRAPRLPLAEREREEVLTLVRKAVQTRPRLPAAGA